MAVVQRLRAHVFFRRQVDQGQVGVVADLQAAFAGNPKTFRYSTAGQAGDFLRRNLFRRVEQ